MIAIDIIFRIFLLLLGFGFSVAGGITIIAYLNLIASGHDVMSYVFFVVQRIETYFFLGGILLIWISIYFPSSK